MPQLDKVHFFSQYFWLCVFYFSFYFLVAKYFLPRMARILQLRKNKVGQTLQDNMGNELKLAQESRNTALGALFSTCHKFWSHNTHRMDEWYKNSVLNLNHNYLKDCNKLYIKKIGLYSLAQNAALTGVQISTPPATYAWLLAHRLKQSPFSQRNMVSSTNPGANPATTSTQSKLMLKRGRQELAKNTFSLETQSGEGKKGKKLKK